MRLALLSLTLLAACGGGRSEIVVSDAWARETVAGQTGGAAYVTIENRGGGDDRLVGASTLAAGAASLHSSSNEGGVARMRPISGGLPLPARETVTLAPSGNHIMLTNLAAPLKRGQPLDLTLVFERSGRRTVPVRIVEGAAAPSAHHGH